MFNLLFQGLAPSATWAAEAGARFLEITEEEVEKAASQPEDLTQLLLAPV